MNGVSGNVLGCSFRFALYSSLLFNKRTYICHLILTILVYGLKTLFFLDLGRLCVLKEIRECKGVARGNACKELYYVYFM